MAGVLIGDLNAKARIECSEAGKVMKVSCKGKGTKACRFGGRPPSWTVALCGTAPGALESAPNTLISTAHAGFG